MKKSLKYLPTLVTLCLLCASQVSAGTYCTHVGASTVKCADHVDCSTVKLKEGDTCWATARQVPKSAIMLQGSAAKRLLSGAQIATQKKEVLKPGVAKAIKK
nr:hypothetical protein [uncultured Cohaesibacter sp.]